MAATETIKYSHVVNNRSGFEQYCYFVVTAESKI